MFLQHNILIGLITRTTRGLGITYSGPRGAEASVHSYDDGIVASCARLAWPFYPLFRSRSQDEDVAREKERVGGITEARESQVVVIKNLFKVLSLVVCSIAHSLHTFLILYTFTLLSNSISRSRSACVKLLTLSSCSFDWKDIPESMDM